MPIFLVGIRYVHAYKVFSAPLVLQRAVKHFHGIMQTAVITLASGVLVEVLSCLEADMFPISRWLLLSSNSSISEYSLPSKP